MLSTTDLRAELDRITYRGWSFTAYDDPFEGQKLRIVAPGLPDSDGEAETIDLGVDSFVPPMDSPEQFHRFVLWRLIRIASHEAREFFRVDGIVAWDPHERQG